MEKFFRQSEEEALESMNSGPLGLSTLEAEKRLERYGPNALAEEKKKSPLAVFLEQFQDLLVIILIVAALIAAVSGEAESTIVIFAVLILNATLGTVQHFQAEKSLESLKAMSAPTAKVLRDGQRIELASTKVVPGDIISLETGDMVVADARILENFSLKVNESSLTGESESVEKITEAIPEEEIALGDQKNMVFSGSLVTYGRALVLVTATGMDTEIGKIASLMNATEQRKTPLQQTMDDFSRKLAAAIMAISVVVFFLTWTRGTALLDALMFAVALAVAAIPEALGSIVTIVQALGTQKMAKQNAIVKDLKAVESLGAVSIICSDKTGTLTQNKMTVQKVYVCGEIKDGLDLDLENEAEHLLLMSSILDSDATENEGVGVGDPTEIALVHLAEQYHIDEVEARETYPRVSEVAFDSERKLMSSLHHWQGRSKMMTKGAIDVLLDRCTRIMTKDGGREMTEEDRQEILRVNQEFSEQGLRVLAFGCRSLPGDCDISPESEISLTFTGLVSMMDPPREESIRAVADAKTAGIRTVMITGDHKVTATAIAGQIGIFEEGDVCLDGAELNAMSDEKLDAVLPQVSVYARVSPEHKIRIVQAWQRRGNIVAMTGDGVNDAPALKAAEVGVAMGLSGTEVSKDAADMILADDNFATILKAVVNGRNVYTNIVNAIQYLLSGNMAAVLCVLYTSLIGLPVPFAAVHLLFINLLTDSLPAIAIGMENARGDLLKQKPRDPKASILSKTLMTQILVQGVVIGAAVMAAFYIGYQGGDAALAATMAFATLTLARLFHGFNCRGDVSIFRLGLTTNRFSLMAFGAGVLLLALVMLIPPLARLFEVSALTGGQLGCIVLLALLPTIVIQIYKMIKEAVLSR